jgi:hypothetical protein
MASILCPKPSLPTISFSGALSDVTVPLMNCNNVTSEEAEERPAESRKAAVPWDRLSRLEENWAEFQWSRLWLNSRLASSSLFSPAPASTGPAMVNSQCVSIFTSLQRDMSILLLMHLCALYLPPDTLSSPFNFKILLYLPSLLLLLYPHLPTFLFPSSYFSPHTALADIPPLKYSCTYVHICTNLKNILQPYKNLQGHYLLVDNVKASPWSKFHMLYCT